MPLRKNKKKCYDIFANLNIVKIKFLLCFFLKNACIYTEKYSCLLLKFRFKTNKIEVLVKVISEGLKPVDVVLKLKSC